LKILGLIKFDLKIKIDNDSVVPQAHFPLFLIDQHDLGHFFRHLWLEVSAYGPKTAERSTFVMG
jgi:hypothetical protein